MTTPGIDGTPSRSRIHDHDDPAPAAPPPAHDPSHAAAYFNDRILYVGMNAPSVGPETHTLGRDVATAIAGSAAHDVAIDGRSYDVTTPDGVRGFVHDLVAKHALSVKQFADLEGILLASPASGRDELARIAMAWAPAEEGASIPSRLVLSGHSSLGMQWGDGTGVIHFQAVRDLGRVLKKAAAQIEDVCIAGCYSEAEVQGSEKWTQAFPNVKTIWAYAGMSPSPGTQDLAAWQIATRGRTTQLSEGLLASHGKATAWSIGGGIAHGSMSLAERQEHMADAETRFDAYFSGQTRIVDAHEARADRDYGAYQMVAAHHDTAPDERARASEKSGQMLRLRYWETSVRGEIADHYGKAINDALAKEGLAPVDFRALSRADAMRTIDEYRALHGGLGPIMQGIVDLKPGVIPAPWCH